MRILGIDPGFANLGFCTVSLDEDGLVFQEAWVIQTRRDPGKHAAVDLFDRCRFIAEGFPHVPLFDLVGLEGYTYPPTTQAAVKLGAGHGVVAAAFGFWDLGDIPPVVILSPQQARKLVIPGPMVPKEEDVHAKLLADHPSLETALGDLPKSKRVHALDAAVLAFAASERYRMSDAI